MAPQPDLIELHVARERVLATARASPGVERVALADAAARVLARDLVADADVPGFANSAMDGYAVRAADLADAAPTRLRVVATMLAGGDARPALAVGECARITTGSPLPDGADTVVIRENSTVAGEHVVLAPGTARGANVRASDDDHARGALALAAGTLLGPAQLGVAASLGRAALDVRAKPRVIAFSTGDELVAPGEPLAWGRRHDSNTPMLGALVRAHGATLVRSGSLRDDPAAIAHALREAARDADLVLTTGGVSAGEADHLPGVVASLGSIVFWKVRMRPGMPVLCGRIGDALVFALPGNPVSVYATFVALVRPALAQMLACAALDPPSLNARLRAPVAKPHARLELRRARMSSDRDAVLWVDIHASQSSGALHSVAESDCLVELAAPPRDYAAGDVVPVHRLLA